MVLVVAGGAYNSATAATFAASNETELLDAIAQANASSDANSTITLTASFAVTGTTLPAITKPLTIDTGAHTITSTGNAAWNVAAGATLTLGGATTVSGNNGLIKSGDGTLTLDGVTGALGNTLAVASGTVLIAGGSQVNAGLNASYSSARVSGGTLILSDTGTKFTANAGAAAASIGGTSGAALVIRNGAAFETTFGTFIGNTSTETGSLTVTGTNSLFDGTSLSILAGAGTIGIINGGVVQTTQAGIGGLATGANSFDRGGTGAIVISGSGSRWDNDGNFAMVRGTLDVLAGGAVSSGYLVVAQHAAATAAVTVSGAGSALATSATNDMEIGRSGNATLTIANDGAVTVRDGAGTLKLATTAGTGTLNIGGGTGQVASKAGTLDAAIVQFGAGAGVVNFNHTDASYDFGAQIAGAGAVNQTGSGTTVLTGANIYSGPTTISGGTLRAGGAATLSAASDYTVATGGTLDLDGYDHSIASLANGGNVRLSRTAGTTLSVTGDYVGNGGTLYVSTVLGDDNSATDLLHVEGSTSGTTHVVVTNVGGAGAQTTGDGIRIVEVDGDSAADAFALSGPAIAGAYSYNLFQNDLTGTLDDGDWYLRADGLAPTLPTYESYPAVLLGLIALPTLQQRVGDRRPDSDDKTGGNGLWTRIEGAHARVKADGSTTDASYDSDLFQLQVGVDGQLIENGSGALVAGLTAQYSRATADVSSDLGNGSNTTEGYGIGANLTWYGANGVYVDSQAQFAWFDTNLSADGVGKLADGNNGTGYALSVELGKELAVAPGWTVTPQAQLAYASVDFDDLTDPFGAEVSLRKGESLKGRVGAALGRDATWQDAEGRKTRSHVYGITSLTYEFLDGATVAVSGVDLVAEPQKFGAELGLGGTYNWADERFALHGEAVAATSFDGSYGYKGTVGLTVGF